MGIASLLQQLLRDEGITQQKINEQINFFDAEGLICAERVGTLEPDHETFAHDMPHTNNFAEAVRTVKPSHSVKNVQEWSGTVENTEILF